MTILDFPEQRYLIDPRRLRERQGEVTLLALQSLGYPRVRNYVSSWAEWDNRDDTSIVTPA